MNTKVIAGNNGQISQKTSNDSVSMSFIPKSKLIYYQFDLKGNFIFSDSIKKKTTDFIKISPENKEEDPLYKELNKIKEADLFDSTFNGVNYKVYSLPTNFKDTSGDEIATQLFFVKNNSLITPFNVSGRYSSPFKDLCFAGFSYHLLSANAKLVTVISDFKPATKEQEELCRLIKKTLK
jgi:hypothetical protein